jgi:hypothetical protein
MKLIASLPSSALLAATLLVGVEAAAQPSAPAGGAKATATTTTTTTTADYTEHQTAGDQAVIFTGDELQAPKNGAYGDTIRKPPGAIRVGLIRPRLNFVSELLKSVENL